MEYVFSYYFCYFYSSFPTLTSDIHIQSRFCVTFTITIVHSFLKSGIILQLALSNRLGTVLFSPRLDAFHSDGEIIERGNHYIAFGRICPLTPPLCAEVGFRLVACFENQVPILFFVSWRLVWRNSHFINRFLAISLLEHWLKRLFPREAGDNSNRQYI